MSLPAVLSSPLTVVTPLQFVKGTHLINTLVRQGVFPQPITEDFRIKIKIKGKTLERNLKRMDNGHPLIETLVTSFLREETTGHLSL